MIIVTKGMNIPKSCEECKFCIEQETNDYGSFGECLLQKGKEVNCLVWNRDDNCPLVPVVVCKDCKHRTKIKDDFGYEGREYCERTNMVVDDNEFCSNGERRK